MHVDKGIHGYSLGELDVCLIQIVVEAEGKHSTWVRSGWFVLAKLEHTDTAVPVGRQLVMQHTVAYTAGPVVQ